MLGRVGKRQIEQLASFTTSAGAFGGAAFLGLLYFTDWKMTATGRRIKIAMGTKSENQESRLEEMEMENGTKVGIEWRSKIRIQRVIGLGICSTTEIRIESGTGIESGTRIKVYVDRNEVRNQKQDCDRTRQRQIGIKS
ncbi:hypothetical protein EVAR_95918_1 [Eumeta japonica]|uniref:Uncharacterized protein n=1 Tax=Eumeta variegata TaxID=151549 RepID=A0A4C1XIG4_EUMVA|nr:hypothetical protein EVAR_95918_1 [Eumeta japonica]